jgi:hypothetical protein
MQPTDEQKKNRHFIGVTLNVRGEDELTAIVDQRKRTLEAVANELIEQIDEREATMELQPPVHIDGTYLFLIDDVPTLSVRFPKVPWPPKLSTWFEIGGEVVR